MQNDSDVPRLLLPEGPGFFGLSDSTLVVDNLYESMVLAVAPNI